MFNIFKQTKFYNINGINIELNKGHMLNKFQEQFCMYVRLIPYLAQMSRGGGLLM